MDLTQFWQLIAIDNQAKDKAALLKTRLEALPDNELAEFDSHYSKQLRRLWHWDLWGAAYVTCGCNSEYDFLDFCNWLLTQGEAVVEQVLAQPDTLASIEDMPLRDSLPYPYCDELDLTAGLLYEQKTEQELPYHNTVNYAPQGKQFKNKPKVLKQTYPQLFAKYWQG
ncbi:DUF4240 domain-containing protein [Pseudoalteromonas rubra]|uniref:DUF4240 domain-containing protein n=1 Tax=Pseudoalteromonas rubra TaxID=43658 RepID=UPI000F7B3AB5|nr:DUF4240 domain-containing protein [Pseudoalteromonas rubra]